MTTVQLSEEAIFQGARRIASLESRRQYLDQVCEGDSQLRRRVELLLEAQRDDSFLKSAADHDATLNPSRIIERAGDTIGPYKLMEQIGEGGFGLVFVAEQHARCAGRWL